MSVTSEHAYVCEDCEGTGDIPGLTECPECYSGLIGADADDCEVNKCDICKDPRLEDDPTLMFR